MLIALLPPDGRPDGLVAIELDTRLALCLVDRALGGEAGAAIQLAPSELTRAEQGVLTYVVARLLASEHTPSFRIAAVVTTLVAATALFGSDAAITWPAFVTLGEDQGRARLWVPEKALASAPSLHGDVNELRAKAVSLEVTIVVSAGQGTIASHQLMSLECGDVVIPDEIWLTSPDVSWRGSVRCSVEGARRTAWWCVLENGTIRVERIESTEEALSTKGKRMEQHEGTHDTTRLVGDAPLELTVELARFTMPLAELLALRPGEIIATGRALGEHVTLRAGTKAVGTGELVNVDGEVGVRLLRLAPA